MNKQLIENYGYTHISKSYNKALDIIDGYRTGKIKPLKTKFKKLNDSLGGGVHKATIYTIGGRPGVGKSVFANRLIFDICKANDLNKLLFLYNNFEMPNYMQVIRELSANANRTVNELKSYKVRLAIEQYNKIKQLKDLFSKYPIYYNSHATTPEECKVKSLRIKKKYPNKHIIQIFDHSRLLTRKNRQTEEQNITKLFSIARDTSVEKEFTNIILSQLNRSIESPDRMQGYGPVPRGSDFFGADSVNQFSNVSIILQRPEMYRSVNRYMDFQRTQLQDILFAHIVKNRDGQTGWIPFLHELKYNKLQETEL